MHTYTLLYSMLIHTQEKFIWLQWPPNAGMVIELLNKKQKGKKESWSKKKVTWSFMSEWE